MIPVLLLVFILINTVFFFVLIIRSVVVSNNFKFENIAKAEILILGIAFTQYIVTFVIENSNVLDEDSQLFAQQLRYIDWLFTTPLLLYTFWKLANLEGYSGDFALLCIMDVVMIVCGAVSEVYSKNKKMQLIFYAIGCLAYVYILVKVIDIMNFFKKKGQNDKRNLGWFFIFGWLIYPIAYFFSDNTRFAIYSIADFINKGVYSLFLSSIIKN
jgi:bacteriorhodopsin